MQVHKIYEDKSLIHQYIIDKHDIIWGGRSAVSISFKDNSATANPG